MSSKKLTAEAGARRARAGMMAKIKRLRADESRSYDRFTHGVLYALDAMADYLTQQAARARKQPGGLGEKKR